MHEHRGNFPALLDVGVIHGFLRESCWAAGIVYTRRKA